MTPGVTTPLDLVQRNVAKPEQAEPSPSPAAEDPPISDPPEEPVTGAEGIAEAVAAQSEAAGSFIETIDRLAIRAGDLRVSLWDVLVVLLVIAVVFAFAYFASKFASSAVNRIGLIGMAQRLLLTKLVSLSVWGLAILIGIDVLGIDLTTLAVFSGALGLAIGFGLQKTFGNLIAGIILLMDRSIKPGDVISVTDEAGKSTFGQIRKIGIRAVSVTTRDQREYLIPNENLMIKQVENWSYSSKNVRVQIPVRVSYKANIAKAEELMLEAAKSCRRVLAAPPPTAWLEAYGESSFNFIIHCWIRDPEEGVGNVRSEVLKKLWWLLQENSIEIPFPQRDLNLRDSETFREFLDVLRHDAILQRNRGEADGYETR